MRVEKVEFLLQTRECPREWLRPLMAAWPLECSLCPLVEDLLVTEWVWSWRLVRLERREVHAPLFQLVELRPELLEPEREVEPLAAAQRYLWGDEWQRRLWPE